MDKIGFILYSLGLLSYGFMMGFLVAVLTMVIK